MKKYFNVTGVCFPNQHYMADISAKVKAVLDMVAQGQYFTINRPRQYGKTTLLYRIADVAGPDYDILDISFEGLTGANFKQEADFCAAFLDLIQRNARAQNKPRLSNWLMEQAEPPQKISDLSKTISGLVEFAEKKVVLLIDEVDKSSDNQLFLNFLGMLRHKYLQRHRENTFYAVILTGVYDIKNLKVKILPNEEQKYNSPWNIAADFTVNMDLQPEEIQPMLDEYATDRRVILDAKAIANRLFYYTNGHPFLVSKLCKIMDEQLLPHNNTATWDTADVDRAAQQLLGETNVNFDELSKNLDNNPTLYQLIQGIVIEGLHYPFEPHDTTVQLGVLHGIFVNRNGLAIHNRMYEQMMVNKMSFKVLKEREAMIQPYTNTYFSTDHQLDLRQSLRKFQELMRAEYSKNDRDFLERHGRLVFLAFLKPLLNGHGYVFKESQVSEEKRLDLLITYYQHRYVVELKIWRGQQAHERGLQQLADYLDILGMDSGFLVIFDHTAAKDWRTEEINYAGKSIFAIWV